MALDFPGSPNIGDEFTGGGFTWTWTGSAWEKSAATEMVVSNGLKLLVDGSNNTTYTFNSIQPSGSYYVSSQLNDSSYEIYLISENNQNVGYTTGTTLEATGSFNRVVVYGATENDILFFEYLPATNPSTSGDVDGGAPPYVVSATPTTLESIDDTTTVAGGNFATNVEVKFVGQDSTDRLAKNIVRSSSTSLIVTRPDDFPVEQEPYSLVVTNPGISSSSIVSDTLVDYFDAGGGITWTTDTSLPAGLPNEPYSQFLVATDEDSNPIVYSLVSSTIPAGFNYNPATSELSGTTEATGGYSITVLATDSGGNTSERQFTFSIVDTSLEYLVIAGGGANGHYYWGYGGAGGYRSSVVGESSGELSSAEPTMQIALATSYPVTIGAGGASRGYALPGNSGNNTVFSTITSLGGGGGAGRQGAGCTGGGSGGSGGGRYASNTAYNNCGPGSGTAGQGFSGQSGVFGSGPGKQFGGGAGASGNNGGTGLISSITGTPVMRASGRGTGARGDSGGDGEGQSGQAGVVILKYSSGLQINLDPGLTGTTAVVGEYKVTEITAGTGNVSWT